MSERLSDWISGYLDYTANTEPSEIFRKWSAISVIAGVLQRKCFLKYGRRIFYPNLYIILVGPSSLARKGTAMGDAKQFLDSPSVHVTFASDSTSRARLIRDIKASQQMYIDEAGQMTVHSSVTAFAPELTVFLKYKDLELLTDLLDWYDTIKDPWSHKTISGDAQEIPGVCMNLFGGSTPDLLRSSLPMEAIGGGLIARMLFIYAPTMGEKVLDDSETPYQIILKEQLKEDLTEIASLGGEFFIRDNCKEKYKEWYLAFNEAEECKDPRFLGYFGRKPATIYKLLMIFSASRGNSKVAEIQDFERALEYLAEMERKMYYALQGFGKNNLADTQQKIMLELERKEKCDIAELMWKFRDDVQKWEMDDIVQSLIMMGFCKEFITSNKTFLLVNPERIKML